MEVKRGGLKIVSYAFSDWAFHKVYGDPEPESIVPLERSISGIPLIFQGEQNSCVDCSVTWAQQFYDPDHKQLSWEWLVTASRTAADGAEPNQVLRVAKNLGIAEDANGTNADRHKIPAFLYVRPDKHSIYAALKMGIVLVGFNNFKGIGPHMMAAYDAINEDMGLAANWWRDDVQDEQAFLWSDVEEAIFIPSEAIAASSPRISPFEVIKDKLCLAFSGL